MTASTKPLFRAMRAKPAPRQAALADFPVSVAPSTRDPLDYDPTPPDATAAFLCAEAGFIRAHGDLVCEPAVGAGHIAQVLIGQGFDVWGGDVVDRGWPGVTLGNFFERAAMPSPIHITNPPYGEISARDGHGRWLKHAFDIGSSYVALLLNADWAAARINGFDSLFELNPPSIEYLCCWKIDFRGGGSPPQRNSWFVWDINRPALGPNEWRRKRLYREVPDVRQGVLV